MTSIIKNRIKKLFIISLWIIIRQILSLSIKEEILLPSPLIVFKTLIDLLFEKALYISLLSSISKILSGFILSLISASLLSYMSYRSNLFYEFINPLIIIFRTIPLASIVMFLLFWIDAKNLSIYVAFIMAMPIIYSNIYIGLKNIDNKLLQMADTYGVKEIKKIRYIYFVKIKPYLISSILSVSGLVFKAGIAAEVIGLSKNSIGINLYNSKIYLDMPLLFARSLIILFISILFENILKKIFGIDYD